MSDIFQDTKSNNLQTHKGSKFVSRWFKKFTAERDVYSFGTHNVPKASIVERSQWTFKAALSRPMRQKRSNRYIDNLDVLLSSYYACPYRRLNYLAPKEVNKHTEADVCIGKAEN